MYDKYFWRSHFINLKALFMNFASVSKEFSVLCWKFCGGFHFHCFYYLGQLSSFLLLSNLLSREGALRMLDFPLISFLLFSTHLSYK